MSSSSTERTHFFTGRQVTTMVVALMTTIVLLPGAVWAVDAFSNVAIQDPVSGVKAKVDNSRRLAVGDGAGKLTVDGTVTARPAAPADFYSEFVPATGNGDCAVLATPPAGKAAVLMAVNVDVYANPSPSTLDFFRISKGTTCSGAVVGYVTPPGQGHTTLPLDPGVVSSSGFSVLVRGEPGADITATGYFVPSSGLPAKAAEASGAEADPNRK